MDKCNYATLVDLFAIFCTWKIWRRAWLLPYHLLQEDAVGWRLWLVLVVRKSATGGGRQYEINTAKQIHVNRVNLNHELTVHIFWIRSTRAYMRTNTRDTFTDHHHHHHTKCSAASKKHFIHAFHSFYLIANILLLCKDTMRRSRSHLSTVSSETKKYYKTSIWKMVYLERVYWSRRLRFFSSSQ